MKSLELFSGAGGLAKGLEIAGFEHAAFVEFNKHACQSLRVNFEEEKVYFGDVRDYDFTSLSGIDLVAGGPPCQPFSLGGKHKANEDSRDMFPYAIRSIEHLQPKAFIFENVKGLLRSTFAEYFEYILLRLSYPDSAVDSDWREHLAELRKIDPNRYSGVRYVVSHKLLNAADYGVPQSRQRVVIVGVRSDLNKVWCYPEPTHSEERLFWDQHVSHEYWKKHKLPKPLNPPIGAIKAFKKRHGIFAPASLPWQTVRDAFKGVPEPYETHDIPDHVFKDGARTYPGHDGSFIDSPAKTLKAGGHGVPGGENMIRYEDGSVRYFTVYEGKILQTFPRDFVVTGAWGEGMRQIGNAVPVLLAEQIGKQLKKLLDAPNSNSASKFRTKKSSGESVQHGCEL